MVFDYQELRGAIIGKYGSYSKFAEQLGISENCLSRKLNNKNAFTSYEMSKICELLGVSTAKNVAKLFFKEV